MAIAFPIVEALSRFAEPFARVFHARRGRRGRSALARRMLGAACLPLQENAIASLPCPSGTCLLHAGVPRGRGRALRRGVGLLCLGAGLGCGAAEAAEPAHGRRFDAPLAWQVPARREAATEGSRIELGAGTGLFDDRGAGSAGSPEPLRGAMFSGALGAGKWRYQLQVKPGSSGLIRGVSVRLQLRF